MLLWDQWPHYVLYAAFKYYLCTWNTIAILVDQLLNHLWSKHIHVVGLWSLSSTECTIPCGPGMATKALISWHVFHGVLYISTFLSLSAVVSLKENANAIRLLSADSEPCSWLWILTKSISGVRTYTAKGIEKLSILSFFLHPPCSPVIP